ncbi:ABC transporter ATP-binding protein [Streptomyces daliensis]|uniref:ABC transporter ATP-binding protein n=1 Tax=Streptomyces daliensis TaxID=299421 RepID=A0A8T4J1I0_9ACTN|nr:ABC transporter ATP-binding protein [Streptomyces daliensis]
MVNKSRTPTKGPETTAPPDRGAPVTPAVHAAALTVVRGARTVIDDLAFDIPRGTVTGLLGPSGCGKSTLMRAIVGTQAKVTGTLDVLGSPAGSRTLRSRVGYVTQDPSVYGDLTARQNLDYYAAVLGVPRQERAAQVERALADVDLTSHADSLTDNLSGGQRSRVSLAVALLGSPELLVLDEPTVGLDPVLRRDLWNLFHRLATAGGDGTRGSGRGTTLLISSHVMDEADRCQNLLLMREGRLLADGSPEALRTRTGTGSIEEAFLHLVDEARATDPPNT